jgi:hypothetical protein
MIPISLTMMQNIAAPRRWSTAQSLQAPDIARNMPGARASEKECTMDGELLPTSRAIDLARWCSSPLRAQAKQSRAMKKDGIASAFALRASADAVVARASRNDELDSG